MIEPEPILILGILQRSGTHYLQDLLCLHSRCTRSMVEEDNILYHADLLQHWVERAERHSKTALQADYRPALSRGLHQFLHSDPQGRRVVGKTPNPRGLEHFSWIFPRGHLLIILRDGRSAAQSYARSFNKTLERGIRMWARNAQLILQCPAVRENQRCLIVRYEELYANVEEGMRRILRFLDLDEADYDFAAARNLPVRGSSQLRDQGVTRIHYQPVAKTAAFNPLQRAAHWVQWQHERFNWLAGKQLRSLGYEPVRFAGSRLPWVLWNLYQDFRWWPVWAYGNLLHFVWFQRRWREAALRRQQNRASAPLGLPSPICIVANIEDSSSGRYIQHLLCLHPACTRGRAALESLVASAHYLKQYVHRTSNQWWHVELFEQRDRLSDLMWRAMGSGLLSVAHASSDGRYPVIVTTSSRDAGMFKRLFPAGRMLWVSKSDLLDDIEPVVRRILERLQLDPSSYDFAAARAGVGAAPQTS